MLFSCFFSESNVYVLKPARWFSLNRFSYKGSYFKFRGEGSQIFWICVRGAAGQGAVWWSSWCNKRFFIYFHPAPKFVREYETNILAHNPNCIYHPSCPVNIMYFYINFYFFRLYFIFVFNLFLAQKYICRKKKYPVNRFGANRLRKIADTFPFYLGSMLQV